MQKVKLRSESEYFVNPEGNYRLKITNTINIGKPSFFLISLLFDSVCCFGWFSHGASDGCRSAA